MRAQGKSGLKKLEQNEILFNDGEHADSLYIIQRGQLRLFKPKGKGFIEIAVLRAGEVIGEMAYFDEDNGRKRSCSASALVSRSKFHSPPFLKPCKASTPGLKQLLILLPKGYGPQIREFAS